MMPHPDCPHADDPSHCRLSTRHWVQQPAIEWEPVYDGRGMLTNSDPNTFIHEFTCATCERTWRTETTEGRVVVR